MYFNKGCDELAIVSAEREVVGIIIIHTNILWLPDSDNWETVSLRGKMNVPYEFGSF